MAEDGTETFELRAGPLRFTTHAQGEGPLVLCLHGFPDNATSFRHQLPALAPAGYRAVAPTLRGYEPSSQPRDGGGYSLVELAQDVLTWIDELAPPGAPVHLIGHDWGAMIAYVVAAQAPERLTSMVTLAVPHIGGALAGLNAAILPGQVRRSWYALFFQTRVWSSLAFARDRGIIDKLWRDWSPGFDPEPQAYASVKATFAQPGVRQASLGYYRTLMTSVRRQARESRRLLARKTSVPTLTMTGARDGCVDTRLFDAGDWRADYTGPARLLRIDDAGHFLHQERPAEVNAAILEWLADPV